MKVLLLFAIVFAHCQFQPVEKNLIIDYVLLTDLIKNMPVAPPSTTATTNPTNTSTTTTTNTNPTNPSTPVEGASIPGTGKILANSGWQATNFTLNKGTSYKIVAYGTWSITSNKKAIPPEGLETNPSLWGDFRYDLKFNHGQLLCRLDTDPNAIFSISNIKPIQTGVVQCRVNDTDLSNNTGFLEVKAEENLPSSINMKE